MQRITYIIVTVKQVLQHCHTYSALNSSIEYILDLILYIMDLGTLLHILYTACYSDRHNPWNIFLEKENHAICNMYQYYRTVFRNCFLIL